jgi:Domain of unknown function (DUF3883)
VAVARGNTWSREEVEATVADYFRMLELELGGHPYNKRAHNRELTKQLAHRTSTAIELKHQNISAILLELGCGYIPGYKPRSNYQQLLFDFVAARLAEDKSFHRILLQDVEREVVMPEISKISGVLVEAPRVNRVREPGEARNSGRRGIFRDYLEIESRNRSLGLAGEQFVAEFEARRLHAGGHKDLANRIDHVSISQGDGLGFDVLSFEPDGRERFIEVKTTHFGALAPFYVSPNELKFSQEKKDHYVLARVHEFRSQPKIFELRGAISGNVILNPASYQAHF